VRTVLAVGAVIVGGFITVVIPLASFAFVIVDRLQARRESKLAEERAREAEERRKVEEERQRLAEEEAAKEAEEKNRPRLQTYTEAESREIIRDSPVGRVPPGSPPLDRYAERSTPLRAFALLWLAGVVVLVVGLIVLL
jgi:hypothetical protein